MLLNFVLRFEVSACGISGLVCFFFLRKKLKVWKERRRGGLDRWGGEEYAQNILIFKVVLKRKKKKWLIAK